jgi:hypothetical protein
MMSKWFVSTIGLFLLLWPVATFAEASPYPPYPGAVPIAYGIKPQINGNTITFELDRPRYFVLFLNEYPSFYSTGLMLFAEPPRKNPPKLGDPSVE